MPDMEQRVEAMTAISAYLFPKNLRQAVLQEAEITARQIKEEYAQTKALMQVASRSAHLNFVAQAFEIASSMPNDFQRAECLKEIVPDLMKNGHYEKLLQVFKNISLEYTAAIMASMTPWLPAELREQSAIQTLDASKQADRWEKGNVIKTIAPYLPASFLSVGLSAAADSSSEAKEAIVERMVQLGSIDEAVKAAKETKEEAEKGVLLSRIVTALIKLGHIKYAFEITSGIEYQAYKANSLVTIAGSLPDSLKEQALEVARGIKFNRDRVQALVGLAPYLAEPKRTEAFQDCLAALRNCANVGEIIVVLKEVAPFLPETMWRDLLNTIELTNKDNRITVLSPIARYIPKSFIHEVIGIFKEPFMKWHEADLLNIAAELLPQLAQMGYHKDAFAFAMELDKKIYYYGKKHYLSVEILPYVPKAIQHQIVTHIFEAAENEVYDALNHDTPLEDISLRLAQLGFPDEAFQTAQAISRYSYRTWALEKLVPFYTQSGQLVKALDCARAISDGDAQDTLLSKITDKLIEAGNTETVLPIIRSIRATDQKALAFSLVIPYLSNEMRETVLPEALQSAIKVTSRFWWYQAEPLSRLSPYLFEPMVREALQLPHTVTRDQYSEAVALPILLARLAELGYPHDALIIVKSKKGGYVQAKALTSIVPHLPHELLAEATEVAVEHHNQAKHAWDEQDRKAYGEALAVIALRLITLGRLEEALVLASSIHDVDPMILFTMGLARKGHYEQALAVGHHVQYKWNKAEVLANLYGCLPSHLQINMAEEVIDLAVSRSLMGYVVGEQKPIEALVPHLSEDLLWKAIRLTHERHGDNFDKNNTLEILLPCLARMGRPDEALIEATNLETEGKTLFQSRILTAIAPFITEQALQKVVAMAHSFEKVKERCDVLIAVAPRMIELGHYDEAFRIVEELFRYTSRTHYTLADIEIKDIVPKALKDMALHLTNLPFDTIYPIWCKMLHLLICGTRRAMCYDLSMLVPVIVSIGGPSTLFELDQCIKDVTRWWP